MPELQILWLLPAFFPFCLAFGGIIVPKTYLVLDLICQDYLSDRAVKDPHFKFMPVIFGSENPQCRDPHVQSLVAKFQLYQSLLSGVFSAIVSPHLGALSDRIGRKKVIAFAILGTFCAEGITIIVGTHPGEISVYWILVGYLLDGLCGSFTTTMALSFAYAADCTPPERRNVAFGYFHGTLFAGIALGPILTGYLMNVTGGIMIVFYVALGCDIFFILFLLLAIPESVSKERQLHAREKHQTKMQAPEYETWLRTIKNYNLFEPLSILWPKGAGSSRKLRRNLVLLAAIDTTMFGVAMGTLQVILIYAEFKFGWDAVKSSMFLSAVNLCRVVGLVVGLPLLTRLVRGPLKKQTSGHRGADRLDINIIRSAILFDLLGYIGYATAQTGGLLILAGMIASLGGLGSPTLQSALTKHIPSDQTGQVLGATGLLHALARVVAPTIFNLIYSQTVEVFPQTVFVCLASLFILAAMMSWFLKPNGLCLSAFEKRLLTHWQYT
jgi:MFS family permease